MNKNNNNTAFEATERLLKSADSLDFALTGQDKKNTGLSRQGLLDFGSVDPVFGSTEFSASLFDDWLSNDLQQAGFIGQEDLSLYDSDSTNSHSPVLSNKSDSPVVGFDSISSDTDLIQSPRIDSSSMAFFPDLHSSSQGRLFGANTPASNDNINNNNNSSSSALASLLPLTPEAVQQAAAALNIPWSKSLEQAVLAQSLLAALPGAMPSMPIMSLAPMTPPLATASFSSTPATTTPATPKTMPNHGASINVAHDHAMDMSPPCTPTMPMSPSLPLQSEHRAQSVTPSMPSSSSTPRLSILSSTQTQLPIAGASSTVKATTYKSTYRSASLLKRELEIEAPPSVLDGKDVADMDEVSLKRAKNTDAARRSRHKKLIKMESLEQRVAELEVENSMFESKLNEVELERSLLADKDQMQQARIQELEMMLSTVREKLYH
ncbi:hypothetical protein BG011_002976 [Mortierella polycephala]|uniref:BZIP domain-containing protein n=1 Tax=Mortierella polycephala TaxID=41804 RepID=A0A9P6U476_9FUNG|nr:hypothetical protein BG011_002976 [Mortierella polycephala]